MHLTRSQYARLVAGLVAGALLVGCGSSDEGSAPAVGSSATPAPAGTSGRTPGRPAARPG